MSSYECEYKNDCIYRGAGNCGAAGLSHPCPEVKQRCLVWIMLDEQRISRELNEKKLTELVK